VPPPLKFGIRERRGLPTLKDGGRPVQRRPNDGRKRLDVDRQRFGGRLRRIVASHLLLDVISARPATRELRGRGRRSRAPAVPVAVVVCVCQLAVELIRKVVVAVELLAGQEVVGVAACG
jgi:hypothetical protein